MRRNYFKRQNGAYSKRYSKFSKQPVVKEPRPDLPWTPHNVAIFDHTVKLANIGGAMMVNAVAGSGKTTTLVETCYRLVDNGHRNILAVAFNKSIERELTRRVPEGVTALTVHSLGLRALKSVFKGLTVDTKKGILSNLAASQTPDPDENKTEVKALMEIVSRSKSALAHTVNDIEDLIRQAGIETAGVAIETIAKRAKACLDAYKVQSGPLTLKGKKAVDFDDMVWLPIILDIKPQLFSIVFVDEVQDLSPARTELIARAVSSQKGTMVAVGDPRQAIYGFAGADLDAYEKVCERFDATELPLSVSWRCSKAVINFVRESGLHDTIESPETACDGSVTYLDMPELLDNAQPGNAVLSPTNAPLARMCLRLVKSGQKACILGRDIGDKLAYYINKVWGKDGPYESVNDLLGRVAEWSENRRGMDQLSESAKAEAADTYELVSALAEDSRTVEDVFDNIDRLFADEADAGAIVFSTVHKFKGKERDKVFVLDSLWFDSPQTENMKYVAYTRAKKDLVLVSGSHRDI